MHCHHFRKFVIRHSCCPFSTALCYIYIAVFKLPPKPVPTQRKNVLQSGLENIFNFFKKTVDKSIEL